MSVEAIKKALEGVTPDRLRYEADAMFAAVQGEEYGDTHHAYNWADKPHRVLYDAVGLMRDAATIIESLQRENETLRASRDGYVKQRDELQRLYDEERDNCKREAELATHMATDCNDAQARAEAAEAEVKRLQAEIDRKSSMPGDHRYWEGRYRDEAAENERLREALEPFRTVSKDWVDENGWTDVACQNDRIVDWFGPSDFRALASTGGEHNAE